MTIMSMANNDNSACGILNVQVEGIEVTLHKCSVCGYAALTPESLQLHINSDHNKSPVHPCNSSSDELTQHLEQDENFIVNKNQINVPNAENCKIPKISAAFGNPSAKPQDYQCNLCQYSTKTSGSLRTHVREVHAGLCNHHCTLCPYASSNARGLKEHVKEVHVKGREHKCTLCSYATSRSGSLKNHVKEVHLNVRDLKCTLCSYATSRAGSLKSHVKVVHLKVLEHKCTLCSYASSRAHLLKIHMKKVHVE